MSYPAYTISCCDKSLEMGPSPLIMGILNVTPDSFSDGGLYLDRSKAIDRAQALVASGADILDIGGESSRPAGPYGKGAVKVTLQEEIARTVPVIEMLSAKINVPISIDTTKAEVARQAIDAGATIVNDISALRFDLDMAQIISETGAAIALMHMQGTPATMQNDPVYDDVVNDIADFLAAQIKQAKEAGINANQILIDPGLGFGKTYAHNIEILARMSEFHQLGYPLLVGPSRKQFTGPQSPSKARLAGTMASLAFCVQAGVHIMRVHDVQESVQAMTLSRAIVKQQPPETP